MILNAIHLFDDVKRLDCLLRQCNEQKIEVTLWSGITGGGVKANISKAHKGIIQNAKNNSLPMVCVAEDDILLTCEKSFDYFIDNIPADNFDIYFGGISGGMIDEKNEVSSFSGMFLYIVHERFYDIFLSADETKNLDRWLGNIYYKSAVVKPIFKVCNPIAAITSDGYSAHHKINMNNMRYFKPYELYKI